MIFKRVWQWSPFFQCYKKVQQIEPIGRDWLKPKAACPAAPLLLARRPLQHTVGDPFPPAPVVSHLGYPTGPSGQLLKNADAQAHPRFWFCRDSNSDSPVWLNPHLVFKESEILRGKDLLRKVRLKTTTQKTKQNKTRLLSE